MAEVWPDNDDWSAKSEQEMLERDCIETRNRRTLFEQSLEWIRDTCFYDEIY